MDIESLQRVHFVGINGIGTSGVARILLSAGKEVSGYDAEEGLLLKELQALGARTFVGHRPENLPEGAEVVVVSSAVPEDNAEILAAQQRKIPVVTYSEALGSLMEQLFVIAVAGTTAALYYLRKISLVEFPGEEHIPQKEQIMEKCLQALQYILSEIINPAVGFGPDEDSCRNCQFGDICR